MSGLILRLVSRSKYVFPGVSRGALMNRARIVRVGIQNQEYAKQLLYPAQGFSLASLLDERPEMLGILLWPYQCAQWDLEERVRRVVNHCEVIDELGEGFRFSTKEQLVIDDLNDQYEGLRIILDQPKWFMREGQLVMNLFVHNFRAFSVAFSLHREEDGSLCTVIGGVQGRNKEDALDMYRGLTKSLHGLRPRDFLLEIVRVFSQRIGATHISAVADECRHHRHPYFGKKDLPSDYNAIWDDRSGVRESACFYSLPILEGRRDFDTIKPKKRSLYRKRFRFLDDLESRITNNFGRWEKVCFIDL